jgi:hypothetical protein
MKKGSSARHQAVTGSERGGSSPQGGRAARELKTPPAAPPVPPPVQRGSGEMTFGGLADRGITLAALYDTGVLERLRLSVRVRLIADLTQSLSWLHANPRLMSAHRHLLIAPSTIVIGLDGVARIDVRAAKKQSSERSAQEVDYLAPEVLDGNPDADHRADIYSVGVLAWEALAGQRLSASAEAAWDPEASGMRNTELHPGSMSDVPAALAGGRGERDPSVRRKQATRAATPPASRSRLKVVPPLSLPDDAQWAMPFAQLALQAMCPDVSQRPTDCRGLLQELELVDASRLASHHEIAEVVQGISAVATLCVPEPTFPATDASCQTPSGVDAIQFDAHEACASSSETCVQHEPPPPRRVPEHVPTRPALEAVELPVPTLIMSLPARRRASEKQRRSRPYSAGWALFAVGLLGLLVVGSLVGFLASRFAAH